MKATEIKNTHQYELYELISKKDHFLDVGKSQLTYHMQFRNPLKKS